MNSESVMVRATKNIAACLRGLILIRNLRQSSDSVPLKLWISKDKQSGRSRLGPLAKCRDFELLPRTKSPNKMSFDQQSVPITKTISSAKPDFRTLNFQIESSLELETGKPENRFIRLHKKHSEPTKTEAGVRDSRNVASNLFFRKRNESQPKESRGREVDRDMFRVINRKTQAAPLSRSRADEDTTRRLANISLEGLGQRELISSTYDESHRTNMQARLGKMLHSLTKTQDLDMLKLRTASKDPPRRLPAATQTAESIETYVKTTAKIEVEISRRKPTAVDKRPMQPPVVVKKQRNNLLYNRR